MPGVAAGGRWPARKWRAIPLSSSIGHRSVRYVPPRLARHPGRSMALPSGGDAAPVPTRGRDMATSTEAPSMQAQAAEVPYDLTVDLFARLMESGLFPSDRRNPLRRIAQVTRFDPPGRGELAVRVRPSLRAGVPPTTRIPCRPVSDRSIPTTRTEIAPKSGIGKIALRGGAVSHR